MTPTEEPFGEDGRKEDSQPPGEPTAKLQAGDPFYDLVEEAYEAFETPAPADIGTCGPCCMDQEVYDKFFTPSIRELPFHYLEDWFFSAPCIQFPKDIWIYLLPRILEVMAAGETPNANGIELSLNRFPTGDPKHWTSRQWQILESFRGKFLYEFGALRAEHFHKLDDIICTFAIASWNLDSLFAQVEAWSDEILIDSLWTDWCAYPNPSLSLAAFWESPLREAAWEWYTSPKLVKRVEAAERQLPASLASKAAAILCEIRKVS